MSNEGQMTLSYKVIRYDSDIPFTLVELLDPKNVRNEQIVIALAYPELDI